MLQALLPVFAAVRRAMPNSFGGGFDLPESRGYATVGGFVNKRSGHIPEINESFRHNAFHVTVVKTADHHVSQVKVELRRPADLVARKGSIRALVDAVLAHRLLLVR